MNRGGNDGRDEPDDDGPDSNTCQHPLTHRELTYQDQIDHFERQKQLQRVIILFDHKVLGQ